MLYFLSFLLSWLSGMLAILITAFLSYDEFSIIDITSFASLSFAAFIVVFLLIYLITLRIAGRKVAISKQFISFPIIFCLPANLPIYFFIWKNVGDLYGISEATLFTLGFFTSGIVFGLFWAWKNKVPGRINRI